jgi:uncharacterized YccA/Bax inhibitor family protein
MILGIESLWVVVGFGMIWKELVVGALRRVKWFCTFVLTTTLVWIHLEAVKPRIRLSMLFSRKR